jgi:hypothetical protein
MVRRKGLENNESARVDVDSKPCGSEAPKHPSESARYPVDADAGGPGIGPTDPVEVALAGALTKAAEAGRFHIVAQLARELEARRLAREPNVVVLPAKVDRR